MTEHSSPEIAALEQIAIVCTDNMDRDCDHRMALDFVRQIANDCLARAPAQAAPSDPYAKDVADWCQRSLDDARSNGHLETRPFVQNVELIISALRAYASPAAPQCACGRPLECPECTSLSRPKQD